jgi:thiol-disulfide isomerase/thioredoxin
MLKYHFFRDEIKMDIEKLKSANLTSVIDSQSLTSYQKRFVYPKRHVAQLAETDKQRIAQDWKKLNKHFLLIYVPNWAFLKEAIFEEIFFKSSHLFDGIQVTNSKNFCNKYNLYDPSQISEDIPQIYLVETNKITDRKAYSFNYFRYGDDFMKYLKNKSEAFKQPVLMENYTYVKTVNNETFRDVILNDNSFKEFMIEIKHEGCPTCFMLGKMFDHVSQKFQKHGYSKRFKFFRIDTHNDMPYLGEFAATPTYLFCRKNEKGEIIQINPVEKNEFLFKIKKLSKMDLAKVRYHPNLAYGFYIFQRQDFLKPNYEPDIDISGFAI